MTSLDPSSPQQARVVLLSGPSGSGKSVLGTRLGLPVVELDEFYRDGDDPGLPRRYGIVDWDDPRSWDRESALAALVKLTRAGRADLPEYSIPTSRRIGTRNLNLQGSPLLLAEGIFASELIEPLHERGLLADAVAIDRPRLLNFVLRLSRDVRQSRKPLPTLVRRGLGLLRDERRKMNAWRTAGMTPLPMRHVRRRIDDLLRDIAASARITRTHVSTAGGTAAGATSTGTVLRIAGVCFVRPAARPDNGRKHFELLSVRKRGTTAFMLPGGKLEPGETAAEAAAREVAEELTVTVADAELVLLGDFEAEAANETDTTVVSSVFLAPADALDRHREQRTGQPVADDASADDHAAAPDGFRLAAEIVESFWCPIDAPPADRTFAPLTVLHVLPALRERFAQ